jgi:3'(2'), 5'-bisphosphate nucleotidase
VAQPITGVAESAAPVPSGDSGDIGDADDALLAAWLAARAGVALSALRKERGYADQPALRASGDRLAHELLVAELARLRPADAVLSEEGRDDPARLRADRVWIVDPLDGTREFAEEGRVDWAVHVALWSRAAATGTGDLVAGAVALPAQGIVFGTGRPPTVPAAPPGPARLAASRTRPPAFLRALAERLDGVEVPMGSAGAKIAAVVSGDVDAYVHAGGQYEWDSAAPVAVARAAGLHTSRVDGSALVYNRPDPRLPDLVVCRPELAAPILDTLAALGVTADD